MLSVVRVGEVDDVGQTATTDAFALAHRFVRAGSCFRAGTGRFAANKGSGGRRGGGGGGITSTISSPPHLSGHLGSSQARAGERREERGQP